MRGPQDRGGQVRRTGGFRGRATARAGGARGAGGAAPSPPPSGSSIVRGLPAPPSPPPPGPLSGAAPGLAAGARELAHSPAGHL